MSRGVYLAREREREKKANDDSTNKTIKFQRRYTIYKYTANIYERVSNNLKI